MGGWGGWLWGVTTVVGGGGRGVSWVSPLVVSVSLRVAVVVVVVVVGCVSCRASGWSSVEGGGPVGEVAEGAAGRWWRAGGSVVLSLDPSLVQPPAASCQARPPLFLTTRGGPCRGGPVTIARRWPRSWGGATLVVPTSWVSVSATRMSLYTVATPPCTRGAYT